jgi:hypothetical protein
MFQVIQAVSFGAVCVALLVLIIVILKKGR